MDNLVPWKEFHPSTMEWFLQRFTLHDSALEGVSTDSGGAIELRIGLDLHWNSSIPEGHTLLWIRFDHPYLVIQSAGGWPQSTLEGASSAQLDMQQRGALRDEGRFDRDAYQHSGTEFGFTFPPDDESLTRTVFDCVNWGKVELLHAAPVRFVAAKEDGGPFVDLTTIAPRSPLTDSAP